MARNLNPEELAALRRGEGKRIDAGKNQPIGPPMNMKDVLEQAMKDLQTHPFQPQVMMVPPIGYILPLANPALMIPGCKFEVIDIEWETRPLTLNPASWPRPCGWGWITHFWQHGLLRPSRMIAKVKLI